MSEVPSDPNFDPFNPKSEFPVSTEQLTPLDPNMPVPTDLPEEE